MRISTALVALVATATLGVSVAPAAAGTLEQVTSFGTNPGALSMWRYRPTTPQANAPLVLFLHGCSQTHSDAALVGWTQLADQYGFYVVFPEQSTDNNPIRCFNWAGEYGDPANLVRGQGENLSLKQMVDKMRADHNIDASRIYVAGFSAGAAFANVMLATWPDVFAAGAVMAGIPYRCATTVNGAYNCQSLASHPELKKSPAEWGDLVRNAYPGYTGPRPRVAIFHGTSDAIVSPDNQVELVEQWTNVLATDQTADEMATIAGHERTRYKVGSTTVVESWRVASMGHAVSMGSDPEHACPPTGGSYIENRGMCAAWRAATFFGLTGAVEPPQDGGTDGGMPPDGGSGGDGGTGSDGGTTGGPAVNITAPGDGDEVSGAVTISAEASAGDGVARVEFKIDGVLKGSDGTAPYSYRWQTANVATGAHTIEAVVFDRWEVSASDEIDVMVGEGGSNGDDPTLVDPIPCGCSGGGAGAVGMGAGVLLVVGLLRRRRAA
jgi:poly(hydroxyalkanoate) depolymerase family esterase